MYETENIAAVGDGNVAVVCSVATCGEIATIMIEHRARAEQPLCAEHWQQAHGSAPQSLNVVRTLPRPNCFVTSCGKGAVAVMEQPTDPPCRVASPT